MNALCYKTVFSKRLGALVAVGEHAASQGKGQGAGVGSGAGAWDLGSVLRYVGVLALGFASVSLAWSQTLPQGGRVSQGQVTISQSGQQMAITQSTAKAVVNWDSFDIGANAKVNIAQPSSQSVLLNRVLSDNPTQILGQLRANGQVVLVNPKGIVVGSDGSLSASAFTASTLNISDADFMAGNGRYSREGSTGEVVNKGRINVAPGGYVALLGARVSNEGTIIAPQGAVALGAAETVTVPIGRTGKIKLELSPASINASVANQKNGVIVAEGGQVYMQAAALGQAVASVLHSGHIDTSGAQAGAVHVLADGGQIKVDGRITANSSGQDDQGQLRKGGDIFIGRDEDTGVLAKKTDAGGAQLESQRGFVETSGDHLITTSTRVKAAEWLLDPSDITISSATDANVTGTIPADITPNGATGTSSVVSVNTIQTAINAGTSVTIKTTNASNTTGAGNITLANALVFNNQGATDASLNLVADNGITQNAGASITTNAASAQRVNINLTANGNYQGNTAEHASSQGIVLSSTINTNGAVTLTGTNKNTGAGAGVQFGSGASITTPGAVTVIGTSTSGTGYGVALNNTLIDAGTTGDISITGTSTGNHGVFNNWTYSNAYNMKLLGKNVSIHGSTSGTGSSGFLSYIGAFAGNTVTAAENLSITGIVNGAGTGKAIDHGTTSWQNLVSAYTAGGTLSITGTNASAANTSPTISMVGVQARADGDLAVSATTNNAATDAIFINSSAYFSGVPAPGYIGGASSFVSTGGNTTLKSNQGSILIQDGVPNSVTSTAITGKNVIIDNTGGTFAGGVFTAGSGVSTASGRSGVQIADSVRANDPNLASNPMLRTITATDGGQIVLSGKKASTSGSGVEIRSSAALTAANITINGENTGASGAAINISNGAARLTSTQATTLTSGGVGSGTSLVAAGNIQVGTQLRVTNPAAGTISGEISGAGSLLKSGAGQLTLSAYNASTAVYGTNTFSGGATVSQGALVLGHGNGNYNKTAGTGGIVVGDLNTGNNNVSLLVEKGTPGNATGSLTRDITFTNNGTGTATLGTTAGPAGESGRGWTTVNSKITLNRDVVINDATNDRLTLDGQITGTGNITLTGTRITMGAVSGTGISANDFVGNVTISSGTVLQASAKYNLPTTTNVINNGTLRMLDGKHQSIDGLSGSGKVETTSTSGGLLTTFSVGNNNSSATYTGTIVGTSSPLNLVKNGTGTQVLAGNNNYAGTTTINAGTLQIGNGGTSGTIGTGVITDNGALVFNRSDNGLVVSAKISGTGTVTQAGTGTTTLTANNDWSGSTTISAGTLQIGNGGTTGTLGTSPTVSNNGTLAFNRNDNITAGQKITGTGGLTKAGSGTLTLIDSASLNGANNYSGVTTISAGTLQVGDGGTSGHLGTGNIVNNGNLVIKHSDAVTINQIISGSGKLTQSGTGVTTLTGVNTYTGGTDVVSSMLQIGDGINNGQVGSGTTNIASGATLNFNVKTGTTANYSTSNTFTGTGTLQKTGAGTLTWGSASAVFGMTGGLIDVQAGIFTGASGNNEIWTNNKASLNVATGAAFQGVEANINVDALTGGGTVSSGWGGLAYGFTVGVNGGSGTFSGVIQDANGQAAKLNKIGTGSQILTGNNTYTGTTTISAGVLQVGNGGTTGNLGTGPVIDNAALVFNRSNALTVGNAISGTGTLTQSGTGTTILTGTNTYSGTTTISTGTLQVGNGGTSGTLGTGAVVNNTNLVFNRSNALLVSGAISGTGTLTQMGAGTSTLASDNTYAGTTTVSGGTLQVGNGGSTGTLGAGDVTLSNNATLSYVRSASTTIANTIAGAGNVAANITGAASDLTVNRSINLTSGTANLVTDGNLLVKQAISTTNATASAVFLESGKSTAAGTATGGDIKITGSGAVNVGSGGRVTYMTGSIAGSTGMGVLSGNNRYNSDETTTSYTAALGSGAYAIYREKPLVSVQVNSVTKTYDGLVFSGGSLNTTLTTGALLNGDTFSALTANASYGGTSQGSKNASATPYVISASETGGKNALGYGVTYAPGSLTINKANLTVTANTVTKTYDGTVNATGTGTVAALAGVAGGDVVNNAGSQAFLDANAGSNKTVRAAGVTIKDAANADMTGNYNITYTDNTSSTINKAQLTVTVNNDARFVGRTDNTQYAGVTPTGFVNGETSAVLGGPLSITRTNSDMGAGVYTDVLSASGLTSNNYSFNYVKGNYTILPADQLLIKTTNNTVIYGSAPVYETTAQYLDGNSAEIISLTRTGTGNNYTFNDGLGTTVSAALKPYIGSTSTSTLAGTSTSLNTVVGSYSVKDINPTVSATKNFVGNPVFVGNLTVNTKAITPSTSGVSKVYDGTTAMSSLPVGMTGKLDNDILTIGGTSGAFTEKHAGTGRGYTVSGIALAGADASNYHLSGGSSLSGTDGIITAAPLKLTTSNVIKTYDGTTSATGFAVATQSTQLLATDTMSGGTFAFTNKNASTGDKVVTVSSVTLNDGNNGGNYSVTYVDNTTSTISKANLTLKAVTDTKTYDGTVASNKTVEVTNASGSSDVVTVVQEFANKNVLGPNASTLQVASGFTIKDTGGADMSGNYTVDSSQTAMGTITKKDVILTSIAAANKIYDGGNAASITSGAITTGVLSETLNVSGSGAFADKHAANGKTVTVSDVTTLSKTDGSGSWANYNLTTTGALSTTANITPRALSLSAVTATKTYDGTTSASGTVVVSGNQVGDTITASQVFDSKHVLGTGASTLKVDTFTINDGNDGKNYSVTQNTTTGTIEKASLTVTAIQAEKIYDGTTTATGTGTVGTLAGQAAGESVSGAGTQAFLDKNAGTGNKHVRASGVTIKDSANADVTSNYAITYDDNTTSTIFQKEVSLSAAKTYDGDKTLTGTQLNIITGVGSETLGFSQASIHSKNVADNSVNFVDAVTLSNGSNGGLASNYKLPALSAASDSNNVTLTAKALTGAIAGVAITYGTTSAPGAVSLVGIIGADDVQASNTATLVNASNSSSGKLKAGNYAQTVSGGLTGGDVSNYSFAGFTTPTATYVVNPLTITLSGITASDKMYDGKTDAVVSVASAQFVGKINGDDLSVTSSGSFADQNAGQNKTVYLVNTLGGADLGNYSITPQTTAQAEISKAPLLVKVGSTAMFVTQDPNTAFDQGFIYVGLQNNETATNVLGTVTRTYVGSANPATGSYANVYGVASTVTPTNYTVSVESNLNVVAADKLLIHVGNASANYGDLTPANAGGRADTVLAQYCLAPTSCNGVNLSNLTMTRQGSLWTAKDSTNSIIQFNTVVDTTGKTSTGGFVNAGSHRFGAEGLTTQGTVNFNGYVVSGGLLTISPKSVTLNASAVTKVYDGNKNLLSAALVPTGAMADDALQAAFTSGNFAGKDAGSQNFNLSGLALQGADQANYVLGNAQFSGTGTITPKAITVSGLQAQGKVYDGTTQATVLNSGAAFNGIVAGDQLSVTATGQFDTRHVGNAKTVSLTSSFGGADLGNYSITPQASSTASITPAPLVVTASAARKTYDGNTTASGVGTVGTLVGATTGDRVDFGGTQAFADKQAGSGKTVTVSGVRLIDGSQTDVTGNYAITYVNNPNGVIDKANASITAQAESTVYNGSTQSQSGVVLSGILTGDVVQASGLASGRNAGSYLSSLSASGADVGNYNITYNNASLNISRRPASLSVLGQTVVYNGQTQSLNGTQGSGFVAGDALSFGALPSGRHVGQYTSAMTVTGADAANYDVTLGNATLFITPKSASVTARPERVTYNGQTQQQSASLLEGFVAGDDIRISGLASGRNAGVYGSNVLATGQDAGNYSITYQQGALTIDKAPLQFVGTLAADKQYDGNTQASVTPGRITGLVGNESLSVLSLTGQFDTAEPGSNKPVTVVYGLGDGQNGGLAANYDWSPVKVMASIRREASPNQATPEASRPVGQYSRLTYIGFGGLTGMGMSAAKGQLYYPVRNTDAQQCTPRKLEECICEQPQEGAVEICYPNGVAKQAAQLP